MFVATRPFYFDVFNFRIFADGLKVHNLDLLILYYINFGMLFDK